MISEDNSATEAKHKQGKKAITVENNSLKNVSKQSPVELVSQEECSCSKYFKTGKS